MKERGETSVRICGVGGQGIVMAGNILAEAFLRVYPFATNSTSYGPEVRGASVRSDVLASSRWIDYPRADRPGWVIALAQKVYDSGLKDFGEETTVLYDPALLTPPGGCPARHVEIPASQTCLDRFGDSAGANLMMLGALAALGVLPCEALEASATGRLRDADKAGRAIRIGRELAEKRRTC